MQASTGAGESMHPLPPGSSAPAASLLLLQVAAAASSTRDRALMQHLVMEEGVGTAARLPASQIFGEQQIVFSCRCTRARA